MIVAYRRSSILLADEVLAVLNPTAGEGGYARARGELERLEREVAVLSKAS